MTLARSIARGLRAVLIAIATAAAAFGLLVVLQPFAKPSPAPAASAPVASQALKDRIEALRFTLRDTEAALAAARIAMPATADASRAQYEAQIAAATERRDLALRHAAAIRAGLEAGVTVSSLAEIRDSVVIGQLLSQQSALEAQIATTGAQLRANHPTMRALTAQRIALKEQIQREAASIASALEAEARMDEAQIELLQAQLSAAPEAAPVDSSAIETQLAAQRAELDSLVDAYFDIPPVTSPRENPANPLSLPNLLVVGIAGIAALLFQMILTLRRARRTRTSDAQNWQDDEDLDTDLISEPEPLRKAS